MLYSVRRRFIWTLKMVAIVVVSSYVISGCMDKHRGLAGPSQPESSNHPHRQLTPPPESRPAVYR